MILATVVVVGLCAYRATRVVTSDTITEPFRDRVYRWAWIDQGDNRDPIPRGSAARCWFYSLVSCPVCLGVWFTLGVWAILSGVPMGRAWFLGFGAAVGVQCLASLTDRLVFKKGDDE